MGKKKFERLVYEYKTHYTEEELEIISQAEIGPGFWAKLAEKREAAKTEEKVLEENAKTFINLSAMDLQRAQNPKLKVEDSTKLVHASKEQLEMAVISNDLLEKKRSRRVGFWTGIITAGATVATCVVSSIQSARSGIPSQIHIGGFNKHK